eukprot:TRINITY_DN4631_c0_g1_i7.p2 TRINITY_DN4631_c0_g1~~TRINITY_DN4631_c0_g1_i7.p2  ORF type:complete len:124 (-),score=31.45 TRINITY_DN4631_c0_g1_i7:543-914(-)
MCIRDRDLCRSSLLEKNHQLESLRHENIQLKLKLQKALEQLSQHQLDPTKEDPSAKTHSRTHSTCSGYNRALARTDSGSWSIMSDQKDDTWTEAWNSVQGSPHASVHTCADDVTVASDAAECG